MIYNYLCNQCLWVRISIRVRCTTLCDKVCQWLATGRWFSPGPLVSSNKTDRHNITEILLKVALNTIKQTSLIIKIFPMLQFHSKLAIKLSWVIYRQHTCTWTKLVIIILSFIMMIASLLIKCFRTPKNMYNIFYAKLRPKQNIEWPPFFSKRGYTKITWGGFGYIFCSNGLLCLIFRNMYGKGCLPKFLI